MGGSFSIQLSWWDAALPWLLLLALGASLLSLPFFVRPTHRPIRILSALALLCVLLGGGVQVLHPLTMGVELDEKVLRLRGAAVAEVDRSRVHGDRAQLIDLDRQPSFEIATSLDGLEQRGYRSGWMLLRNGMVVLALVGSGRQWVVIPTSDHFYIAVDAQHPQDFQSALLSWSEDAS